MQRLAIGTLHIALPFVFSTQKIERPTTGICPFVLLETMLIKIIIAPAIACARTAAGMTG
jgi:hypothetical protein